MKPLSALDCLVYFGIIVWSILSEVSSTELIIFVCNLLLHLPGIIVEVVLSYIGLRKDVARHYRNITNPLQYFIILLVGYAFNKVDYRIGRLFFNPQNCLRFLKWRSGVKLPLKTFTIASSKEHQAVLVYQFDDLAPGKVADQIILYVHGGGLIVGSVPFYAEFLTALVCRSPSTIIYSPEYGLVPEASYPVQVDQIVAVLKHISSEHPDARVVLGGDSAGAGLCQSVMLRGSIDRRFNPKDIHKCFYISPWFDFASRLPRQKGRGDYISPEAITRYGKLYTASLDQSCTLQNGAQTKYSEVALPLHESTFAASPSSCSTAQIQASLPAHGMLLLSGGAECLLSDSKRFVSQVRGRASFDLNWHIEPDEIHAYVLTNLYLRRGHNRLKGLEKIIDFLGIEDCRVGEALPI